MSIRMVIKIIESKYEAEREHSGRFNFTMTHILHRQSLWRLQSINNLERSP